MPLPPGFAALAADDTLADTIGLDAHALLLWLARRAQPTSVPAGGWAVIDERLEDIANATGYGLRKTRRLLADLETWQLVVTEPARRLGQGFGMTRPRRFLATDPSMTLPTTPPPRGSKTPVTTVQNATLHPVRSQNVRSHDALPQRHLTPVVRASDLPERAPVTTDDDVSQSSRHDSPPSARPTRPLPTSAQAALEACGYRRTPPPDVPVDVLTAVARYVADLPGIRNRGAYLHRILATPGEAVALAASVGLVTINGSAAAHADTVARMSVEDYWDAVYADDDFAAAVATEAARRAHLAGFDRPSLALLREVAYQLRHPDIATG